MIPRNVRVSEAPSHGKPVLLYDLKCAGSQAYLRLASEIIQRERALQARPEPPTAIRDTTMAEEAAKSRLGRGLGGPHRRRRRGGRSSSARAGAAQGAGRVPAPEPAQPAQDIRRGRTRRSRGLDPRARHRPADRRAAAARPARRLRDRRRRAALAGRPDGGLHEVPVIVVEIDDKTSLEYAILENVQRADLNAIEEAQGYQRLMDEFSYTHADLARDPRQEPAPSQQHDPSSLSASEMQSLVIGSRHHGRTCPRPARRQDPEAVAKRIVDKGSERPRRRGDRPCGSWQWPSPSRSPAAESPEGSRHPRRRAGARGRARPRVTIHHRGQAGEVRIRYKTLDQLDGLCRRLRDSTLS